MTATVTDTDLAAIKAKQQKTWSSGNFSVVASRIVLASELLAERVNLRAGDRVLDVACGNGNATLAAARSGAHAVGIDYVPDLLEDGRVRAAAEGLDVEFKVGDAEKLPFDDNSFDATLSVFGAMFAPDHQRTADELARVTRPGGSIGLSSWTPDGFIGQLFRVVTSHVAPPTGVPSPLLWGMEPHVVQLFGDTSTSVRSVVRECVWRFRSAEEFVTFFRRWYGPVLKAYEALDGRGQNALTADLIALATECDRNQDGGSLAIPATYLESVVALRRSDFVPSQRR